MQKRKLAILLAIGALAAGFGVASALADSTPVVPIPVTTGQQGDNQGDNQDADEQGAANDVTQAADDVQLEADNQGADDEQGDGDQGEEQGDNGQSDD
jgi:hypothetical protein